jgi:hypothetical protein
MGRAMSATSERALNRIAALGLIVGAALGLAGTLVASPHLQASLWAIDSVGLVIATALLALKHFRAGADVVAGGRGPARQRARLRRRHGTVGGRPGPRKWTATTAAVATAIGHGCRLFVCSYSRTDLHRRGTAAHLVATTVLGLSIPGSDTAGLGLPAGARGPEIPQQCGLESRRAGLDNACGI